MSYGCVKPSDISGECESVCGVSQLPGGSDKTPLAPIKCSRQLRLHPACPVSVCCKWSPRCTESRADKTVHYRQNLPSERICRRCWRMRRSNPSDEGPAAQSTDPELLHPSGFIFYIPLHHGEKIVGKISASLWAAALNKSRSRRQWKQIRVTEEVPQTIFLFFSLLSSRYTSVEPLSAGGVRAAAADSLKPQATGTFTGSVHVRKHTEL